MNDELQVINKVSISPEARIDYETMFNAELPIFILKPSVEDYLNCTKAHCFFNNRSCFRCVWYDKSQNRDLMLFFDGGCSFRSMQIWFLVGICAVDDLSDEFETHGTIRNWLNTKIEILNK